MDATDLANRLAELSSQLAEVVARLSRIEQAVDHEAGALREALQHERDSRRALADQTTWLIEALGDARRRLDRQTD